MTDDRVTPIEDLVVTKAMEFVKATRGSAPFTPFALLFNDESGVFIVINDFTLAEAVVQRAIDKHQATGVVVIRGRERDGQREFVTYLRTASGMAVDHVHPFLCDALHGFVQCERLDTECAEFRALTWGVTT